MDNHFSSSLPVFMNYAELQSMLNFNSYLVGNEYSFFLAISENADIYDRIRKLKETSFYFARVARMRLKK